MTLEIRGVVGMLRMVIFATPTKPAAAANAAIQISVRDVWMVHAKMDVAL
jgi:hypothetical protein